VARAQLSLATVNLANLQLPNQPMYRDDERYTQEQYDAKIAWTAKAVQDLDADIIGFQELWHPDTLTDVFTKADLHEDYHLPAAHRTDKGANRVLCG
jgi:hypothetical protein